MVFSDTKQALVDVDLAIELKLHHPDSFPGQLELLQQC